MLVQCLYLFVVGLSCFLLSFIPRLSPFWIQIFRPLGALLMGLPLILLIYFLYILLTA